MRDIEYVASDPGDGYYDSGYGGPGWYFWDEIWDHCYGPYDTYNEAMRDMMKYQKEIIG